ncbi:MAG: hypothetical protein O2809_06740 [Proteobacteria bacterium]|nr:hypothetical protein [Pseudomonadota bacterium]
MNNPQNGQMMRQYSLSAADENAYRITVKKEQRNATHPRIVSNFLHQHINEQDEIAISAPTGSFLLKPAQTAKAAKITNVMPAANNKDSNADPATSSSSVKAGKTANMTNTK